MGQLFSSEEELSQMKDAIGSLLYDAMLQGGAVPDLGVVHPLLLANHDDSSVSQDRLQEQLQQLQNDIGNRAPTYLRDLISRLSTFSDEPRLAGLVGLVVTMVMDMAYTSAKQSSVKGKSAGSSSYQQRVWELQEVMEEYLKRCRISLNDKSRLIQDTVRLEAQLSLILTQLKTCLLGGDCDSRSLRHWASGASFHTQMLVHLARLEGKAEPLSARAALQQYKEDVTQIIPAYRRYKSNTVCVVKCRGSLLAASDPCAEVAEEGAMTGLTVTDRETGKSVTIPLSTIETETGRRRVSGLDTPSTAVSSSINLDLITSDQYTQAYLDHLFSAKGPVAELENYFNKASERLKVLTTELGCTSKAGLANEIQKSEGVHLKDQTKGTDEVQIADRGTMESRRRQGEESLKLSIVESQPDQSLNHSQHGATSP
ncbi:uncharacterized protein LOC115793372 [Archocentrus centrarchus]|uniref:uncharacterized protein LOC115793372 n=1 Tax=Archocentrus centrarchus TaxID=63155 RepID=UPI0011EA4916|nr:uncharacterized protein LOC115793372 [Archocentrus centrarchus]XP_030604180.1 uncharacterized protein LOC115793372 [Archocentrus centrarchus]XP_030604181.1 uncharacterized protein LOC115793372 [Archocentrus centrarchus]XP_030604182.1 uncharacterized protein LOC115793372 [Archocentrus centrarchus]XP_030604183.1 uncharacterized protein LOC115793372 [Archocentrus centrarchus]XP_030604184.1 uncharacterized protein LOC115793372 [Archocentrus centrarchus]XP_030604185.1 uncharacterized protein LO